MPDVSTAMTPSDGEKGADAARKKKGQPSRKGKKAWAKNIDITDVESALDDLRTDERVHGGRLSSLPDSALFSVDKSGDTATVVSLAKAKKRLRIDEILTPDSKIPGVSSRARARGELNSEQRALAKKKREASKTWAELVERKRRKLENGKALVQRRPGKGASVEPIWTVLDTVATAPTPEAASPPALEFIPPAVVPKRPSTLYIPPIQQVALSTLPHPGASYNPTFEDHQEALREAVTVEEEKARKRREAEERAGGPNRAGNVERRNAMPGEEEVDGSDEDEEEEEEKEGSEVDDGDADVKKKEPKRKTRQERNREARRKEIEREEAARKEAKKLEKQLKNLPNIVASLPRTGPTDPAQAPSKPSKPPRLGPHRAEPPVARVLLTEELPDALRKLQPEGNLLEDMATSMFAKGVMERRIYKQNGAGKFTGKGGKNTRKEFETHTYKRFQ
ncbi:P60-like protein [Gonapodya prolifera JEL478]|uniref:Ribosome biogenesis protein NOP53 n=1 Tax=Gonapodya prolifera (strain JEL478) TaxID=1344416 RepID=A0A138ZZZ9_GONPJ|nr:P60-like protein [Gonapodya prolifera JEL478]|eukprot:KXS10097.1 P60-like protein [Gonapodya prolifera JEL478]